MAKGYMYETKFLQREDTTRVEIETHVVENLTQHFRDLENVDYTISVEVVGHPVNQNFRLLEVSVFAEYINF